MILTLSVTSGLPRQKILTRFNFVGLLGVDSTAFSNLCALCAGTGADKCSTDSAKNEYVSHSGAFKCMANGTGDVAFLKHSIAEEMAYSGGYGNLADYEYLCKDGSRKGKKRMPTYSYNNLKQ